VPQTPKAASSNNPFGAQADRPAATPRGLSLNLVQYAGPAKATFEQTGIPVVNGLANTVVRFPEPGIYKLRAIANDGALSTTADVVVTVK
jgi:hypothetical protein